MGRPARNMAFAGRLRTTSRGKTTRCQKCTCTFRESVTLGVVLACAAGLTGYMVMIEQHDPRYRDNYSGGARQTWSRAVSKARRADSRFARGFSLVELILVVAIGAVSPALMSAIAETVTTGPRPLVRVQAQLIALSYIEEIVVKNFPDLDSVETGGSEGETRASFDDVWDYDAIQWRATNRCCRTASRRRRTRRRP